MDLNYLVFIIVLSFFVAKLEINIEGKHGWAEKLPTRRIKNKVTDLLLNGAPLTEYHFWLFSMILFLLHLPFSAGLNWSIAGELKTLGFFFLFLNIEDFLWFVLNPEFGIKKFNRRNIPWHKHWIGFLPRGYYIGFLLFALALYISQAR